MPKNMKKILNIDNKLNEINLNATSIAKGIFNNKELKIKLKLIFY